MPRKTAAQRFEQALDYSEDLVRNPLVELRGAMLQKDFAATLGVNKGVIAAAEEGMYALIPKCYRKYIIKLLEVNEEYQTFRRTKRQFYFDPIDFPMEPAPKKPMNSLIAHFSLTPYAFGARACVHHTEIWSMCTTKRNMTENFTQFLIDVGIDQAWQDNFNAALQTNAFAPVKLRTTDNHTMVSGEVADA
jgi:hypothetical protein